jgi:16S rRNA (guanine527-N7)-methyltransferase
MRDELGRQLQQGGEAMGIALPAETRARLLDFLDLLVAWNRAYNLTAVRDPREMVTRHLLDSLAIAPHLRGPRVLDIGSGAGLPGIPLALLRPDWRLTLIDKNGKKLRFLRQARAALHLANVEPVQGRVEQYQPGENFDTLVSRAYSDLAAMVRDCRHLLGPDTELVAMKGRNPRDEIAALPEDITVQKVASLVIPGLDAARHLVVITAADYTRG